MQPREKKPELKKTTSTISSTISKTKSGYIASTSQYIAFPKVIHTLSSKGPSETKGLTQTSSTSTMLAGFIKRCTEHKFHPGYGQATIELKGIDGTPDSKALETKIESLLLSIITSNKIPLESKIIFYSQILGNLDIFLDQQLQTASASQTSSSLFVSPTDSMKIQTEHDGKSLAVSKLKNGIITITHDDKEIGRGILHGFRTGPG